jgi:hypothetical protein
VTGRHFVLTLKVPLIAADGPLSLEVVEDSFETKVGQLDHPSTVHNTLGDGQVAMELNRGLVQVLQTLKQW